MDAIYELPYARRPHPAYGAARIPAYHMIRFSVAIQRGCFGGCTFCSITEHEGRIIQSRSEDSVIREIETIRDQVPGFTGVISDLGGPTANMYRLHCKSTAIESACRRPSCVFPGVCPNLEYRSCAAHQPVPARARTPGRQESLDRLRRALRPGDRIARVCPGTRDPPYRRISQDRARGHRRGPAVEDDETRGRRVLPLQGTVRQVLEGGRQGAIPHSVFHRGAPGHPRSGHARAGAVAEEERISRRPGAGVPALAHGDRHRDVSLGQESAQGASRARARRSSFRRGSRCVACTRPSCAITTRRIGRCCARR